MTGPTDADTAAMAEAVIDFHSCTVEDRALAFRSLIDTVVSREHDAAATVVGHSLCALCVSCDGDSPNYREIYAIHNVMRNNVMPDELERLSTEINDIASVRKQRALLFLARMLYVLAHEGERG